VGESPTSVLPDTRPGAGVVSNPDSVKPMGEASALRNDGPPAIGDVIADKYRVESVVGNGGMGIVLSARHLQLGQTVAIKVLSATEESRRVEANTRFIREAQAAAGLRSDHVVRIYDVGTLESGLPYMVMELLRGSDLGTVLDAEIRLDQTLAVDFVLQACDAIAEAHTAGIVHRDLKPSNLFVTERSDGSPLLKVLDFGISKTMSSNPDSVEGSLTSTRAVMGSPYYMSPEQVRDARRVDGRSDIWALGVILHEALTGEPAFQADTFPGVCAAIVADPPIPVHVRRPDVHPELERVVMRCLEKDQTRRYQRVEELVAALLPFSSRAPAGPSRKLRSGNVGAVTPAQISSTPRDRMATGRSFADGATLSYDEAASEPGRSARIITGDTKTQLSADLQRSSARAAAPKSERGTRSALLGGAAALLTFGALAVFALFFGRTETSASPPATAPGLPAASVAPSVPPAPTNQTFTLEIDSSPAGAEVFEGSVSLGTTPLTLTLSSPEAGKPRVLQLKKAGFKPYMLEQGPARGEVRLHAALVAEDKVEPPLASAAAAPAALPRRPNAPAPAKKPPSSATIATPPSDIRLQR
jgi:eukaryotic-like serine/threonine-protein kinase